MATRSKYYITRYNSTLGTHETFKEEGIEPSYNFFNSNNCLDGLNEQSIEFKPEESPTEIAIRELEE